jgi:flagellar basal body-associated protein FliL
MKHLFLLDVSSAIPIIVVVVVVVVAVVVGVKNVLLLSTLHNNVEIDSNHRKKKPDTVVFYNSTKCGVDVADQMAKNYSVKVASRRWPVQVFFSILDLAGINS